MFGPEKPYKAPKLIEWLGPLNQHVLHIKEDRTSPNNVKHGIHLNQQVVFFAREILELWRRFEADSAATDCAHALRQARENAVRHAAGDAGTRIAPIF